MKLAIGFILIAIVLVGLYGCGGASVQAPATQPSTSSRNAPASDMHADHNHEGGDAVSAMSKMKMELAKLSPADAASAEKQHVCPVSGEMLGVMGAPIKIDVNGRSVWICCENCRDAITSNPDRYLAKLSGNE